MYERSTHTDRKSRQNTFRDRDDFETLSVTLDRYDGIATSPRGDLILLNEAFAPLVVFIQYKFNMAES